MNATKLAELAISSARALEDGSDGISYLKNAKNAGVTILLSDAYENNSVRMTGTVSLPDALRRRHEKGLGRALRLSAFLWQSDDVQRFPERAFRDVHQMSVMRKK
jgi:hypothetical protein